MTLHPLARGEQWLRIGFDPQTGTGVDIPHTLFEAGCHIIGPTGCGKSRLILALAPKFFRLSNAATFLLTSKGALCHQARALAIADGLAARIDWLDPADGFGYNPLFPNGASVANHAKAVREAVRASWGASSLDQTPQLARFLFLVLYAVRDLELTFVEALGMLRPQSEIRRAILPAISDPYIRQALEHLDSLKEQRQDELLASTLARLESFVADPTIRRILTQQSGSFNVGEAIRNHRIVLGSFRNYDPIRPDDNRLLLRMLINDLIAHQFANPGHITVLIIDEAQDFMTADLCRALDQGREIGLRVILAHQYLQQLQTEGSDLIKHSVMNCARTRIVFGGLATNEMEELTPELMIDQFNPWRVKDELTSLEAEPYETVRHVLTEGESTAQNLTRSEETSQGQSQTQSQVQEQSHGRSLGISREDGISETVGETQTYTSGHVSTRGRALSSGSGSGSNYVSGTAESVLPDGGGGFVLGGDTIRTASESSSRSSSSFSSDTDSSSEGNIETMGNAYSWTRARNSSQGQNITTSKTHGTSQSQSRGVQKGQSQSIALGLMTGRSKSVTHTPFHEYKKRRIVSSRQFLNKDEQMTMFLQKIKSLPRGHFVIKTPTHKAAFLRAPFVRDPWVSERQLAAAMERIYQQPFYATTEQIKIEEQERAARIRALLREDTVAQTTGSDITALPRSAKPRKMKTTLTPQSKNNPQTPWDSFDIADTSNKLDGEEEN